MRFQYLLADNDNTLMDFDAAERAAFTETLFAFGLTETEETFSAYCRINKRLWEALERGETTQALLKVERFRQLLQWMDRTDTDAQALAAAYADNLGHHAELMPGCMAFLERMHGRIKLALVSNGIGAIQRGRLALCPFTPLLDAIVISGEIGVNKPDPRIIDLALKQLGCTDKSQAVLLGDSASSDIAAANNAGIASIHLAMRAKPCDQATWVVHSLEEAAALLEADA